MALQTSGAISLNDIHVEAGGSSGTLVGINDSDVRGLTGASSGASSSFSSFYGTSSTWSRIMTVGHSGYKDPANQVPSNSTGMANKHWDSLGSREYVGSPKGSFSPDALFDNGAAIECLHFYSAIPIKGDFGLIFEFALIGTHSNSGWNNLIMDNGMGGTVSIARTSMVFVQNAGGAGNFFPTYPTTRWQKTFVTGIDTHIPNRQTWFRSGTPSTFPQVTSGGPTPAINWQEGAQINVTIS
mgnify:CR=1 FL=1